MFITLYHVISYDIWFYISHVLLHHKLLYPIHKIHHNTEYKFLTFLNTGDGHIVEIPLQTVGIFAPLIFYSVSSELLWAFAVILLRGYMRHDHRCSFLIGNHHLLHHKYSSYNFGEYWIDLVCGTCYPYRSEYVYGILYT